MTMNEEYMKDGRGRLIPRESIKPIDLERDALVREIVSKATELNRALSNFRLRAFADIEAFAALSAEKYGTTLGGKKGNISLTTFDGEYKILRAVSDVLVFDERLQAAKHLIDECINEWAEGSRVEIRTLINDAFNVDKQGNIQTARVLGLRRLDFQHEKWLRAMDAISDSLNVANTRSYIRIYRRNAMGEYQLLNLSLATV